jgi:hypothetical protein
MPFLSSEVLVGPKGQETRSAFGNSQPFSNPWNKPSRVARLATKMSGRGLFVARRMPSAIVRIVSGRGSVMGGVNNNPKVLPKPPPVWPSAGNCAVSKTLLNRAGKGIASEDT